MRVYLRTFGCRANQYDSENVRALVERAGGTVVDDPAQADAAVFNSCAVTAEAEIELRKAVRGAARRNPRLRSVVMGCAAALDRGALRELPTVQQAIPGADLAAVAAGLGLAVTPNAWAAPQSGTRALLRIQDGCDEHCTFCATVLARGSNRSRRPEELVAEAVGLAERHPEIVITGVHIGSYGSDIGFSLGKLLQLLVRQVPGVRFRLSSIEATEVGPELAELFAHPEHLAPHLHAPLQSASDRVLKRMGRHWYTARSYATAVERLLAGKGAFGLGADLIAGFPGETEEDHRATLSFVAQLPFTYLHVFPYSPRPGTAATRLQGQVAVEVVRRRAAELRALARAKAEAYRAARHGGTADVVVVRGERREGLTGDYLAVRCQDGQLPRGTRFKAQLELVAGELIARSVPPSLPV
jgi:threonylcarbamoyladenosine tRNA methylthiotransferase MtaB